MQVKVSVMVVDDDVSVRDTLCENLEECGFAVTAAKDGQEALQMIEEGYAPAVVITDLIMPRTEGLEVIMSIRRQYPNIRLIAISGGGRNKSADFLHMAAKLGADAVLPKPLNIDELETTIRQLIVQPVPDL